MELSIFSSMAAAAGKQDCFWSGELTVDETMGEGELNERIFRAFNRVDEKDVAYLESVGFELPSLSVGDVVIHSGSAWRVDSTGFEKLSPMTELLGDN